MNPTRTLKDHRALSYLAVLSLVLPFLAAFAVGQEDRSQPDPDAYVHEKAHYTIVLPKGFEAWTDEQVKAL
ncbi:MAG: hypothetical protein ACYTG7_23250, partial [Planctomycetota bacterium]